MFYRQTIILLPMQLNVTLELKQYKIRKEGGKSVAAFCELSEKINLVMMCCI